MTDENIEVHKQLCKKIVEKYPKYDIEYLINKKLDKLDIYQDILYKILYGFNEQILEPLPVDNIQIFSHIEGCSHRECRYLAKFRIDFNFKHKSKNPFRDWDCLPLSAITSIEDLDDITIEGIYSSLSSDSSDATWIIEFCIPSEFFEEFEAILFTNVDNIFTNIKMNYENNS